MAYNVALLIVMQCDRLGKHTLGCYLYLVVSQNPHLLALQETNIFSLPWVCSQDTISSLRSESTNPIAVAGWILVEVIVSFSLILSAWHRRQPREIRWRIAICCCPFTAKSLEECASEVVEAALCHEAGNGGTRGVRPECPGGLRCLQVGQEVGIVSVRFSRAGKRDIIHSAVDEFNVPLVEEPQ